MTRHGGAAARPDPAFRAAVRPLKGKSLPGLGCRLHGTSHLYHTVRSVVMIWK